MLGMSIMPMAFSIGLFCLRTMSIAAGKIKSHNSPFRLSIRNRPVFGVKRVSIRMPPKERLGLKAEKPFRLGGKHEIY
jgi:hypothetical protein